MNNVNYSFYELIDLLYVEFVAADIGSEDSITRMLLITDFHAYGSLFEYLQRGETLSVSEALHLAYR